MSSFQGVLIRERSSFQGVLIRERSSFQGVLIREVSSFQGVLIREVSSFQGVLIREVSSFQGVPIREVLAYLNKVNVRGLQDRSLEVEGEKPLPDQRHDGVSRFHVGTELGPAVDREAGRAECPGRCLQLCECFL